MAKQSDILKNMPIVYFNARQLASRLPPSIDIQDLISCGVFGLIDALNKYDSTLNVKFKTYANFRIRGAMLDYLRKEDITPRSAKKKARAIRGVKTRFYEEFKRQPSNQETAILLNISDCHYEKMEKDSMILSSVGIPDINPDFSNDGMIDSVAHKSEEPDAIELLHMKNCKEKLISAIEALPEFQRMVINLFFYENMSKTEIAKTLKVSVGYISQVIPVALSRLRRIVLFRG